jgi:hypothetical protein
MEWNSSDKKEKKKKKKDALPLEIGSPLYQLYQQTCMASQPASQTARRSVCLSVSAFEERVDLE